MSLFLVDYRKEALYIFYVCYKQKQVPQMKERAKLESQARIMLGPQLSIERVDSILKLCCCYCLSNYY